MKPLAARLELAIAELEELEKELPSDHAGDQGGATSELHGQIEALKDLRAKRFEQYGYGIKTDSSWGGVSGPVGGTKPERGVALKAPLSSNTYITRPRQPVGGDSTGADSKISKGLDTIISDVKLSPGQKVFQWASALLGRNEGELVTTNKNE